MADDCGNGAGNTGNPDDGTYYGKYNGCKGLGAFVYGYWGRDIHKRIAAEKEQARQAALLRSQIEAGGIRTVLYIPATSGEQCSCYKETNQQPDRKCKTCHGNRYAPGYYKFGFNTVFMSPVDTDITLTNTEIVTSFKSSKIGLISGQTSGTVESGDKSFTRSAIGSVWESDEVTFLRDKSNSSATVEYSLDSGSTWKAISQLETDNPSSGTIRFRCTLTRDSSDIVTPLFEIVRARYGIIDVSDDCRWGPWILSMYNRPKRKTIKSDYGDTPLQDDLNLWTAGLSMFDPSITVGSSDELLSGDNIVLELMDGAISGSRYVINSIQASDPFAYIIVSQNFIARYTDDASPFSLIW